MDFRVLIDKGTPQAEVISATKPVAGLKYYFSRKNSWIYISVFRFETVKDMF